MEKNPQTSSDPDCLAKANALLAAAQRLREIGRPASEYPLMLEAVKLDGSSRMLKALFDTTMRASNFDAAESQMPRLVEVLENDAAGQAWLEKAKLRLSKRPISYDLVKQRLALRRACAFTPVPRRICYLLHNALPYASGGYATRAQGVASGLKAVGFDPICITRPGFPVDTLDIAAADIAVSREVDGITYQTLLAPSRKTHIGQNYINAAASVLKELFLDIKPELVMAASNYLTAFPAQIAARELGLPFVYEVRGFWEVTRVSREPEFAMHPDYANQVRLEALAAQEADHVFTLTGPMKEELISRGVDGGKITLLPNSCAPERFVPRSRDRQLAQRLGIPDETPVIGYIGTFVQYEGLDNLTEACGLLAKRGMDFRLMLVGNENVTGTERGPITKTILKLAEEMGLSSRLILPGRVPHDEVEAYYSLIDIAPFPRKPQPVTEMVSPMKPLEAFAMEKAVVASSVKALSEMVQHEHTGLLFEKGNIESLANTLARLIGDPALRRKLGKAGRKWVEEERTWKRTASVAQEKLAQFALMPKI